LGYVTGYTSPLARVVGIGQFGDGDQTLAGEHTGIVGRNNRLVESVEQILFGLIIGVAGRLWFVAHAVPLPRERAAAASRHRREDGYDSSMPSKGKAGEFAPLPSTLERSPKKAQDTYEATLESAEQTYTGDEERAHRAAWASVKHSFEKVGDHWEPKDKKGPSDPRASEGGPDASGPSYGGVDVLGKTKAQLLDEGRRLGAHVTTHMTKAEVATEIERANQREDRARRSER
jgi:cation transport regulator ChaB